ncbi:MAG: hypothetical protein D6798_13275 [Deltaproteobacteria bacterium]|nr:MAG: hypothetical protein D6798_13275 [Deltaproteobacteria bacterium]
MDRNEADADRRLARWGLVTLLVVTALAYLALLPAGFAWDDEALVVDNQVTGDPSRFGELFTRDLWSTTRLPSLQSGYYRPLLLLSLAADRAVFGLNPAEAHLHSLAWHLLAVGLLFGLLRTLVGTRPALLGATIFALHPANSEVVALVAARNDSMATALVIGAVWTLLEVTERRPGRLVGGALLALAGLLSKESALLAPVMLLAVDLGRGHRLRDRPGRPALWRGWRRYLALAAAVALTLALRALVGVNAGIRPDPDALGLVVDRFDRIIGVYAGLLVWPWPLSPARHLLYLPPLSDHLLELVIATGLAIAAVVRGRRRGLVVAGLAFAGLAWLPSLGATLDKGLLGERYLYMPLAGVGMAVAAALSRVPLWLPAALAAPAVLALQLRLPDWHDSETVWRRAHEVAPTPFTAAGYGWYVHRDGDYAAASDLLVEAVLGDPPYRDACDLVLMSLLEAHQEARAVEVGRRIVAEGRCRPDSLVTQHLAIALAGEGYWDEAIRTALERPGGPDGPSLVVVAAGRARAGDLRAVATIAGQQPDPVAFVHHVARLLRLGGEADAAGAVLGLLRQAPPPTEADDPGGDGPERDPP